jgi:hypothetical protein
MGQNYDTGGALRRRFEAPTGTGTLFGQTMGLATAPTISFQRLRVTNEIDSAPLLAASIFLDILNVFQFFLSLFGRSGNFGSDRAMDDAPNLSTGRKNP